MIQTGLIRRYYRITQIAFTRHELMMERGVLVQPRSFFERRHFEQLLQALHVFTASLVT